MDFYKSCNSNSTSSQHSNSNSSLKSHASSSNNGASYNLEYCTSSSSLSPFGTRTNLSSVASCPSSSAKTIVNVGLDEVILSISNSSSASHISASSSCSSPLRLGMANNMCSSRNSTIPSTTTFTAAAAAVAIVTSSVGIKRKRSASISLDDRDTELGFGPSPKRQQGLYRSSPSVASSAYPSPFDELLAEEINSDSSSECLSTFKVVANSPESTDCLDISDNPNSPEVPDLPDSPDSPDTPNRGVIDRPYSPDCPDCADDPDSSGRSEILDSRGSSDNSRRFGLRDSPESPDNVSRSEMPESPNSLRPEPPDTPNSFKPEDEFHHHEDDENNNNDDIVEHDDRYNDSDHIIDDDDIDDCVSITSPCSLIYMPRITADEVDNAVAVYHGERTPGQRLSIYRSESPNELFASHVNQSEVKHFEEFSHSHYDDCMTPAAEPEIPRQCPLPALSWANAHDVWQLMCKKDEQAACLRDVDMLDRHPSLQPRMRAILLDWMTEVCEVYKLHRETYYLAVDYLDRYLNAQRNIQKTHLQLIGITCLFVAAKVEEIYPPKVSEFAYVTDGACQESDILQHEILLLQTLDWNVCPVTPIGWLGMYMQLNINNRTPASFQTAQSITTNPSILQQQPAFNNSNNTSTITVNVGSISSTRIHQVDEGFIYPQFSGLEFVQTAQLLDLCSLDIGIANYPYSVLAAAAISHTFNRETAVRCSGLDWQIIRPCARWMAPFFEVVLQESHNLHLLEQNEEVATKNGLGHICPNIVTDDSHIMQTHNTSMAMFDRACLIQQQLLTMAIKIREEASPATGLMCPDGLLTPPASSRKPKGDIDEDDENHQGPENENEVLNTHME